MKTKKAFCSWSGGKDSALALHRAMKDVSIEVTHCLNTITEDGKYSRSHGIRTDILRSQVEAMGFSIVQVPTTWDTYEAQFKKAASALKEEGISVGIFGDIDLEPHREWVERVCEEIGITPILPLWLGKRDVLMNEFIDAGFEAVVTATEGSAMGKEWLGRAIDQKFIDDLSKESHIDLCGEKGEYHTIVLNGPMFKKRLVIRKTDPGKIEKHWFLNITDFSVEG